MTETRSKKASTPAKGKPIKNQPSIAMFFQKATTPSANATTTTPKRQTRKSPTKSPDLDYDVEADEASQKRLSRRKAAIAAASKISPPSTTTKMKRKIDLVGDDNNNGTTNTDADAKPKEKRAEEEEEKNVEGGESTPPRRSKRTRRTLKQKVVVDSDSEEDNKADNGDNNEDEKPKSKDKANRATPPKKPAARGGKKKKADGSDDDEEFVPSAMDVEEPEDEHIDVEGPEEEKGDEDDSDGETPKKAKRKTPAKKKASPKPKTPAKSKAKTAATAKGDDGNEENEKVQDAEDTSGTIDAKSAEERPAPVPLTFSERLFYQPPLENSDDEDNNNNNNNEKPQRLVQDTNNKWFERNEKRHKQFVNKLSGRDENAPSVTTPSKKKSKKATNNNEEDDEGEGEEARAVLATPTKQGSLAMYGFNSPAAKKTKYTPLEQQVIAIKKKYPNIVLLVEVGYKYRFFGEDAEIAAKVLNIVSYISHNFLNASIPAHRLSYHLKKIVDAGYKAGVVTQIETSALKAASANKSQPFIRDVTAIYTKSTLISEDIGAVTSIDPTTASSGHLMCLVEDTGMPAGKAAPRSTEASSSASASSKVKFAFVSVGLSTGDIVYEEFEDDFMRRELESRLCQIQPAELLVPQTLSKQTEHVLRQETLYRGGLDADCARFERIENNKFSFDIAYANLIDFYSDNGSEADSQQSSSSNSNNNNEDDKHTKEHKNKILSSILELPRQVVVCLGVLVDYLKEFKLERVLNMTENIKKFSTNTQMTLTASTLKNLEILQNSVNGTESGSLLWLLNHTNTGFGARLLKQWICHPLLQLDDVLARQEAVEEIISNQSPVLCSIPDILRGIPDLERGLARIHYQKCSPKEFLAILKAFNKILQEIPSDTVWRPQVKSKLLIQILESMPTDLGETVDKFLDSFSHTAAEANQKLELFTSLTTRKAHPKIDGLIQAIDKLNQDFNTHLNDMRKLLRLPNLQYKKMMNAEYLVEVPNTEQKKVPMDWIKVNQTKKVSRFHNPKVLETLKLLQQNKERLMLESAKAWNDLLKDFSEHYAQFRIMVDKLAVLDCLYSLADTAEQQGYTKPILTQEPQLIIEDGRHPVVEAVISDTYVPNSVSMGARKDDNDNDNSSTTEKCIIITGPNMGGKSSFIKQTALIVLMAQIGSYVPAKYAKMGLFDAIYTRMGASDNISKGQSTFLVEMQEASEILQRATDRSLVVLDELGRGTSTHDGTAIAYATLRYIVEHTNCFTLFVTHYPVLAVLEEKYPGRVVNFHVSYMTADPPSLKQSSSSSFSSSSSSTTDHNDNGDGDDDGDDDAEMMQDQQHDSTTKSGPPIYVTFLYKLIRGCSQRSFGLNVARLANIPESVIKCAEEKSREFELATLARSRQRNEHRIFGELGALLMSTADLDADNNGKENEENELTKHISRLLCEDKQLAKYSML